MNSIGAVFLGDTKPTETKTKVKTSSKANKSFKQVLNDTKTEKTESLKAKVKTKLEETKNIPESLKEKVSEKVSKKLKEILGEETNVKDPKLSKKIKTKIENVLKNIDVSKDGKNINFKQLKKLINDIKSLSKDLKSLKSEISIENLDLNFDIENLENSIKTIEGNISKIPFAKDEKSKTTIKDSIKSEVSSLESLVNKSLEDLNDKNIKLSEKPKEFNLELRDIKEIVNTVISELETELDIDELDELSKIDLDKLISKLNLGEKESFDEEDLKSLETMIVSVINKELKPNMNLEIKVEKEDSKQDLKIENIKIEKKDLKVENKTINSEKEVITPNIKGDIKKMEAFSKKVKTNKTPETKIKSDEKINLKPEVKESLNNLLKNIKENPKLEKKLSKEIEKVLSSDNLELDIKSLEKLVSKMEATLSEGIEDKKIDIDNTMKSILPELKESIKLEIKEELTSDKKLVINSKKKNLKGEKTELLDNSNKEKIKTTDKEKIKITDKEEIKTDVKLDSKENITQSKGKVFIDKLEEKEDIKLELADNKEVKIELKEKIDETKPKLKNKTAKKIERFVKKEVKKEVKNEFNLEKKVETKQSLKKKIINKENNIKINEEFKIEKNIKEDFKIKPNKTIENNLLVEKESTKKISSKKGKFDLSKKDNTKIDTRKKEISLESKPKQEMPKNKVTNTFKLDTESKEVFFKEENKSLFNDEKVETKEIKVDLNNFGKKSYGLKRFKVKTSKESETNKVETSNYSFKDSLNEIENNTKLNKVINTNTTPKYESLMDQVNSGINMTMNKNLKEIKIKLHPEDLGELEIKMKLENSIMKAEFIVDNEKVKELLESRFDELKNSLLEKGIDTSEINVSISNNGFGESKGDQEANELAFLDRKTKINSEEDQKNTENIIIGDEQYKTSSDDGLNILV